MREIPAQQPLLVLAQSRLQLLQGNAASHPQQHLLGPLEQTPLQSKDFDSAQDVHVCEVLVVATLLLDFLASLFKSDPEASELLLQEGEGEVSTLYLEVKVFGVEELGRPLSVFPPLESPLESEEVLAELVPFQLKSLHQGNLVHLHHLCEVREFLYVVTDEHSQIGLVVSVVRKGESVPLQQLTIRKSPVAVEELVAFSVLVSRSGLHADRLELILGPFLGVLGEGSGLGSGLVGLRLEQARQVGLRELSGHL